MADKWEYTTIPLAHGIAVRQHDLPQAIPDFDTWGRYLAQHGEHGWEAVGPIVLQNPAGGQHLLLLKRRKKR